MKKFMEAIPFLLLIGLVPFFYYNSPNIAQSIIVLAVSALCGYRLFSMDQEKPNYVQIFQEEFDQYKNERDEELKVLQERHEAAMVYLDGKVKELNTNYGKSTMSKAKGTEEKEFVF
jgi:hypothetical protein